MPYQSRKAERGLVQKGVEPVIVGGAELMRSDGRGKLKRFKGLSERFPVAACGKIFVKGFSRLREGGAQHLFKPRIITIRRFSNEQYG